MSEYDRRVGELRPSQLMFTFGIGSIVELPHLSVMVMGLDEWQPNLTPLPEPRLLAAVQRYKDQLGGKITELAVPPTAASDGPFDPFSPEARVGVPISPFPGWMNCPFCNLLSRIDSGHFTLKGDPFRPDRVRYVHHNCSKAKSPTVLPARFLASCKSGHLQDFPWRNFLRGGKPCERGEMCERSALRLYEFGTSGSAAEVLLKCDECGKSRNMAMAFAKEARGVLGQCEGQRPHLRDHSEACIESLETVLAGASNVWFPLNLSLLSIPEKSDELEQLVLDHWEQLKDLQSARELELVAKYLPKLKPHPANTLWERIERHRAAGDEQNDDAKDLDLKVPEWELFSDPTNVRSTVDLDLEEVEIPPGFEPFLDKVVLAHRLREVYAFLGFTRLESVGDFGGLDEIPRDRWVRISRKRPKFLPAVEVRGEGIFLQFREDAIERWLATPAVTKRGQQLFAAHEAWRRVRRIPNPDRNFPGMRYVLLHTVAHALMRQLSLECGYAAASVRERLYAAEPEDGIPMAGILLYTATPDSEGTLGGLVDCGRPENLYRHLHQALEVQKLCSSDPLCAEQLPVTSGLTLHGAACHACMFASETSCERGNKYLDRNCLVPTLSRGDLGFFEQVEEKDAPVARPTVVRPKPSPAAKVVDPEPPAVATLATEGPIPVYEITPEGEMKEIGRCGYERFGNPPKESGLIGLRIAGGLEKEVAPGTICLLKKLTVKDDLPLDDSLVVVMNSQLQDPDWGPSTLRRFRSQSFANANQETEYYKVTLRPKTTRRETYKTQFVRVEPDDWASWRPFAVWRAQELREEEDHE